MHKIRLRKKNGAQKKSARKIVQKFIHDKKKCPKKIREKNSTQKKSAKKVVHKIHSRKKSE